MTAVLATSGSGASWNLLDDLRELLTFRFMDHAFAAGTIVAVVAGAVGWFMVVRRESFAGHSLAVVGFPGAAGATLLGLPVALGYFVFCIGGAVLIGIGPKTLAGASARSSSASIGTIQSFALAAGVLFTALYHGFLGGIDALLFGDFLGVTSNEVVVLGLAGALVLVALGTIARPLLFASVDGSVAEARGVPVRALGVAFLILLGACVAEVSEITGSLLVFALLVMPAATAQRVTARPMLGAVLTVSIGLLVTWLGLAFAYFSPWPVGFYLTTFAFAGYVAATLATSGPAARGRSAAPFGTGA